MSLKVMQLSSIDLTIYKFILPLMKSLKLQNYEVIFACKDLGIFGKIEQEGFNGYRIHIDRKINVLSNIKSIIEIYKILKKEKVDILHVHTPIAAALGRVAAKLTGIKYVFYTVHGFYVDNPIFYYVEKILTRCFTYHAFTVNQEDYNFAINNSFIWDGKITIINSVGIDTGKFNPAKFTTADRLQMRSSLNIDGSDITIGFIGRLVREKGIFDLVKAFRDIAHKYQNLKLLIIGPSDLDERDKSTNDGLKKIITENKLDNKVIFTGYREDIPELLSAIDIFVLPSYREGMPVSLLEAMAMEIPVVATNIRGCKEEVNDECGILYDKGDIEGLKSALSCLVEDRELRQKMGKKGRQRVVQMFNEEESIRKQLDVYKMVINEVIK